MAQEVSLDTLAALDLHDAEVRMIDFRWRDRNEFPPGTTPLAALQLRIRLELNDEADREGLAALGIFGALLDIMFDEIDELQGRMVSPALSTELFDTIDAIYQRGSDYNLIEGSGTGTQCRISFISGSVLELRCRCILIENVH